MQVSALEMNFPLKRRRKTILASANQRSHVLMLSTLSSNHSARYLICGSLCGFTNPSMLMSLSTEPGRPWPIALRWPIFPQNELVRDQETSPNSKFPYNYRTRTYSTMSDTTPEDELCQAILRFLTDGTFPESENIAAAEFPATVVPTQLSQISKARDEVEVIPSQTPESFSLADRPSFLERNLYSQPTICSSCWWVDISGQTTPYGHRRVEEDSARDRNTIWEGPVSSRPSHRCIQ